MSIPIKIYKKLNKTIDIDGYKIKLKVEYSTHEMTPYSMDMDCDELEIHIHKWTRELAEVPKILAEMKATVEREVAEGNSVNNNINKLTQYFNDI